MRTWIRPTTAAIFASLTACLALSVPQSALAQDQAPTPAPEGRGGGRGGARFAQDPRAQTRTYHFEDTNEDLPYSIYVSTKVKPDQKAPMIVTLHGLGAPQTIMMGKAAIDLAEEGGYILVAPMGYNVSGWYGTPAFAPGRGGRGGRGRGNGAPGGAAPGGGGPAAAGDGPGGPPPGRAGLAPANQPANVRELSEKDVMNVISMVRKELNVDDRRIYLMGHSMGGAGALFLGPKYVDHWAAVASMAPAAFLMKPESLAPVKDKMPLFLAHGDADTVVPTDVGRRWAKEATELHMKDFVYMELPGADHGTVITRSMPDIFRFFSEHTR